MKYLIFSDLHLGKHNKVSEQDGLKILKQILVYSEKDNLPVIFCGDFFDKGEILTPSLLSQVAKTLRWSADGKIFMVSGQHDAEDFEGEITAIDVLEEFECDQGIYNLKGVGSTLQAGYAIYYCQHDRNKERLQSNLLDIKKYDESLIFIGHFLVDEILEADNKSGIMKGDVNFEKHLKHLNCDHYFIGDYHKHIHIPELNLTSIGTCCPTSFKDEGCKASFLIYDTETKEFEREFVEDAPFFTMPRYEYIMTDEVMELFKQYASNTHVRVKVKTEDERRNLMEKVEGFLDIQIILEEEATEVENRLDVDFDVSSVEAVRKYCEYMGVNENFIKKGLDYL
jgi:DNA repair exonuclease SbcCD nuclease subunit